AGRLFRATGLRAGEHATDLSQRGPRIFARGGGDQRLRRVLPDDDNGSAGELRFSQRDSRTAAGMVAHAAQGVLSTAVRSFPAAPRLRAHDRAAGPTAAPAPARRSACPSAAPSASRACPLR